MNILQTIGAGIVLFGIFIGGLFGFTLESDPIAYAPEEEALGADTVLPTGIQTYTLAGTGISSTASSFTLTSLTLPQNGYAIQDSDMSDTFYITFEPGSRSRQEFVSCTTIGANTGGNVTISGCTRGLSPLTPYTASTSLRFAHSGGTSVIFSNAPQLYNEYTAKGNDETITGDWQVGTPISGASIANKDYVTSIITGTSTISYNKIVVAGTAGETMSTGTIVYLKASDSRWYKVDTDDASTYIEQTLAIAQSNGTAGGAISRGVLTYGLDSTQVGMTGGSYIFASSTAGATSTATSSQVLGKAVSATTMFFDVSVLRNAITSVVRTYTTTGTTTWNKPTGLTSLRVQIWGGGGSGARGTNLDTNGEYGGGGGGGYFETTFRASQLSSTVAVVVGSGATAITSGTSVGNVGSTSAFGTLAYAFGGGGGGNGATGAGGGGGGGAVDAGSTGSGATGGAAGDVLSSAGGTAGASSTNAWNGAGGGGATNAGTTGSVGGNALWGGAGGAGATQAGSNASSTSRYGGLGGASSVLTSGNAGSGQQPGGGGGARYVGGGTGNSGSGGDGQIVITEYY